MNGPVLVARTSGSEGQAAFTYGMDEALRRDRALLVVDLSRTERDAQGGGRDERYLTSSVAVTVTRVGAGDPADEVVRLAQTTDSAVIIVGTRHRTAVGKLVMGSIAQRIIIEASCPVLLVKPPA